MHDPDYPVQLISSDKNDGLVLNTSSLKDCFQNPKALEALDYPTVLISVIGEKRQGKSFLMNYIIRALKSQENGEELNLGRSEEPLQGFDWRSGTDGFTKGLWMWSRPFILNREGFKIAVFVFDTEGSMDIEGNREACIKISTLSMLLSSHLIFNVAHSLKETELDYMEMYLHMAEENESRNRQFHDILIRDWHDSKKCSGMDAQAYIQREITKLKKAGTYPKSLSELAAQRTRCFLLPHPGKAITTEGEGRLSDMDKDFLEGLDAFVRHVVKGSEERLKENEGGLVRTKHLPPMMKELVEKLNSLKYNISSPLEMFQALQRQKLLEETVKEFRKFLEGLWTYRLPSSMETIVANKSSELSKEFAEVLRGKGLYRKDVMLDLESRLNEMKEDFIIEYKARVTSYIGTAGVGVLGMGAMAFRGPASIATSVVVAAAAIPAIQKSVSYLAGTVFRREEKASDPESGKKKV